MEDPRPLAGMRVSFTGRGLSFNRLQAQQLVQQQGGHYCRNVNEHISLLVIGAVGWPLQKNGRLTKKLDLAHRLRRVGFALEIESEEEFLRRIGSDAVSTGRLYTLPQLSRLLKLSPQRLIAWMRLGLIRPSRQDNGLGYFDYKEVTRFRTLADLAKSKAASKRLHRTLRQLHQLVADADAFLDSLTLYGSQWAARDASGRLHQPNGQQLFDFEEAEEPVLSIIRSEHDAEFEQAVEWELAGRLAEAEAAYRKILLEDPQDSDVLYNLANVLVEQNRGREAIVLYREAIFYDPEFIEAWNNLGNAFCELGEANEARLAYRQALMIEPTYAAALYGLARSLESCGRVREAQPYWQVYLRLEPEGECAAYARSRLQGE